MTNLEAEKSKPKTTSTLAVQRASMLNIVKPIWATYSWVSRFVSGLYIYNYNIIYIYIYVLWVAEQKNPASPVSAKVVEAIGMPWPHQTFPPGSVAECPAPAPHPSDPCRAMRDTATGSPGGSKDHQTKINIDQWIGTSWENLHRKPCFYPQILRFPCKFCPSSNSG